MALGVLARSLAMMVWLLHVCSIGVVDASACSFDGFVV
jgi:hypothetical protein